MTVREAVRTQAATWYRALPGLAACIAGTVAVLSLIVVAARPALLASAPQGGATLGQSLTTMVALGLATAALLLLLALAWGGLTAVVVDRHLAGLATSSTAAAAIAVRRLPAAVAVVTATAVVVGGLVLLAPVVSAAALSGLLLTPVLGTHPRHPGARRLAADAVPLAAAARALGARSLALPAVWLDDLGPKQALTRSRARASGRELRLAGLLAVLSLLVAASTLAVALGGGLLASPTTGAWANAAATVVLTGLPVVAMALAYRRGSGGGAPARGSVPATGHGIGATAAFALLATLLTPLAAPQPTLAAESTPSSVSVWTTPAEPAPGAPFTVHVSTADASGTPTESVPVGDVVVTTTAADGAVVDHRTLGVTGPGSQPSYSTQLAAGTYTLSAFHAGDGTYAPASDELTLTLVAPKTTTTTTLSVDDASPTFGETITLTAIVTPAPPAGVVTFLPAGGTAVPGVPLAAGVATLVVPALPAGVHEYTAFYPGDLGHEASLTATATAVQVAPAATTTTMSITPPSPTAAGQQLVATVAVAAADSALTPTGTIRILAPSGAALASAPYVGVAVPIPFIPPPGDAQAFTAQFVPHANFAASQADAEHTVHLATASVSLASTGTAVGAPLVLTATVTGASAPTGTVTFRQGPTAAGPDLTGAAWTKHVTAGVAVANVGSVSGPETHWFARYDGDADLATTDWVALAHTATKAAARVTTTVVAPAGAIHLGDDVTLQVTVTGDPPSIVVPTGTVTVGNGPGAATATLAAGTATLVVPAPADGQITVHYGGSTSFGDATTTLTVTLHRRATTVLANLPANTSIVHGDALTITGGVTSPGTTLRPTGRVRLVTDLTPATVATADLDASGGFTLTTSTLPTDATWYRVQYDGNAAFLGSLSDTESIEVDAVESVLTLSHAPTAPALGDTVTLTATLPHVGVGPVGEVALRDFDGVLARATPVDGVARFDVALTALRTDLHAVFAGDDNFDAATSPIVTIHVAPAVPTVSLSGDGQYVWGQTGTITAVVVGPPGIPVAGTVDLLDGTTGDVLLEAVPLDHLGRADVTVCRDGCAPDGLVLQARTTSLTARYRGSQLLTTASSAAMVVTSLAAATATTVTASATSVRHGNGVQLVAHVTNLASGVAPVGDVTFLARDDVTGASRLLGRLPLLGDGTASLVVRAGSDLAWASTTVLAEFHPRDAAAFGPSHARVTILVGRLDTVTEVLGPTRVAAGEPATFTVRVHPVGSGFTERPSGAVTVRAGGHSCTATLVGTGTCQITFTATTGDDGGHVATADYPGDAVFTPSRASAPHPTVVTAQRTTLQATFPAEVMVDVPTPLTWSLRTAPLGGPEPTGEVVVTTASGRVLCRDALDAGGCRPTFRRGDEGPWTLVVSYLGDRRHVGSEVPLGTTVVGCHRLALQDFTGGGDLHVLTPQNCDGGWRAGTVVDVSAVPDEGHRFTGWRRPHATDPNRWVAASSSERMSVTVTDEPRTQRLSGGFERRCHAVSFTTTGSGTLYRHPSHDHLTVACTTPAGEAGWLHGSTVVASAAPLRNATYDEPDEFHGHGPLPDGATLDRLGYVRWTVTGPATLHADFGPVCHTLSVPAAVVATTPHNCVSPTGTGYLRFTDVALVDNRPVAGRVRAGWLVDGGLDAAAGRGASTTLRIDRSIGVDTTWATCHSLVVRLDGAPRRDDPTLPVGTVTTSPAPDCPDGSSRWTQGTDVTLTPVVHEPKAHFRYWIDGPVGAYHPREEDLLRPSRTGARARRTEAAPDGTRTVTLTAPFETRAAFWSRSCSTLDFHAPQGMAHVRSPDRFAGVHPGLTGCGLDYHDRYAGMTAAELDALEDRRGPIGMRFDLVVDSSRTSGLPVVASTNRAVPTCLVVSCDGPVTGHARIHLMACPTIDVGVRFVRSDDPAPVGSRTVYTLADLGSRFERHEWIEADQDSGWGACHGANSTNVVDGAMDPGSQVRLRTVPAEFGAFTFNGWSSPHVAVTTTPTAAGADGLGPSGWLPLEGRTSPMPGIARVEVDAVYTLTCRVVETGPGITLTPAPNCPGPHPPGVTSWLHGTILQATAAARIAPDRPFKGFSHGVVAGSEWRVDETSGRVAGIAIVEEGLSVHGSYPTPPTWTEDFVNGLAIAGKVMVGVAAVLTVAAVSIFCAPCGVALAVVTAATLLVDLIPGTHGVAGAAMDIVNPLSALECAASWGFASGGAGPPAPPDSPPFGLTPEEQRDLTRAGKPLGKVSGTALSASKAALLAKSGQKALAAKEAATAGASRIGTRIGAATKVSGAVSVGIGLYSAGAHETSLDYQTSEDLRNTGAMTSCLEQKYRGVWNAKAP